MHDAFVCFTFSDVLKNRSVTTVPAPNLALPVDMRDFASHSLPLVDWFHRQHRHTSLLLLHLLRVSGFSSIDGRDEESWQDNSEFDIHGTTPCVVVGHVAHVPHVSLLC
jgi:hypothetical protein